ncbi:MAG: protein translocase subunit SecD, partial [Christensenellaceae bacterium]|nr:protein translocase subunit SecD [Christensenellaceae bacterium]
MKVRSLLIFLLVVVMIFACTYVVVFGLSFGVKEFTPLRAVKQGLDLTGGVTIVYEAADPTIEDLDTKIEGAMDIFRSRLDDKGFTEATVTRQGNARVRVEIPINKTSAIADPGAIVDFIGKPAVLEFQKPDGTVIMEGKDLVSASAMMDEKQGGFVVYFEMTPEGATAFTQATREVLGQSDKFISIYLDGELISQPEVKDVITGTTSIISGNQFTQESASELAMQIESGALPLEMKVLEQRTISATLGDEALNKSIQAGILGMAILMVFMIAVFRLPGLIADIALVAYTALVLFFMAWFEVQLTLPGIAGIILGIGMAVDANVVIFSRMREEYYAGSSLRTSVKSGFKKATTAIIDSNVTTLIAAVVLALYGTGSIKG